jgi:hypothetical protein
MLLYFLRLHDIDWMMINSRSLMLRRFNGIEHSIPATAKFNSTTAHFKIMIAEINFMTKQSSQYQ